MQYNLIWDLLTPFGCNREQNVTKRNKMNFFIGRVQCNAPLLI